MTTALGSRDLTHDDAGAVLDRAQRLMHAGDISGLVQTFTTDVVVRFADLPDMHGRGDVEAFLHARFARQTHYRLQKRLRAVSGHVIVCSWDSEWEDGRDGRKMQGREIEILTMRGEEIALWEATFNVWEKGAPPSLPIL